MGIKRKTVVRVEKKGEGGPRGSKRENFIFLEGSRSCKTFTNYTWVNVGDYVPKEYLGDLKFYLVGWWKTLSDPFSAT